MLLYVQVVLVFAAPVLSSLVLEPVEFDVLSRNGNVRIVGYGLSNRRLYGTYCALSEVQHVAPFFMLSGL